MVYWTKKESTIYFRYRAYSAKHNLDNHIVLDDKILAEVMVDKDKINKSVFAMVNKISGLKKYDSVETAIHTISEELNSQ
jgi:hypothetical protein